MLLHVFRHVEADQRRLVVEQELGERLGELGLADAGRPQEHERADRPVRILQAGARAPHRGRDRVHRLGLADDALAQVVLHAQQLLLLAFQHPVDRNAGPARDHLRDVIGGDRLLQHRALAFGRPRCLELLLELGDAAVGQLAGALVFALALRIGELDAQLIELGLEPSGRSESFSFSDFQRAVRSAECFSSAASSFSSVLRRAREPGSCSFFSASCSILSRMTSRSMRVELLGLGIDLHLEACRRLVDQVDRLVGQEAVGDVAVRQRRRRHDRAVGDAHAVVLLVACP